MGGSMFGTLFRVSTFGESHGGAVGVVVDGMPAGIRLEAAEVQKELDRRKPGQSSVTTPRKESDEVEILSGIFEGQTTGSPVLLILYNTDARSHAYDDIKNLFRPGHADFTFLKKYGLRDWRGSGRASGRETAARVAAGVLAGKIIAQAGMMAKAWTTEAAGVVCSQEDLSVIESNPMRACDSRAAEEMVRRVESLAAKGDSAGGIIACRVTGVPVGLGEPVFDKLEADLAKAMLSIGGVKGFEIGAGFAVADMTGSQNNDPMNQQGFLSNNAGGVLGGISSGQDINFRIAVKPTSSISVAQQTVDINGQEREVRTEGRHDPCLCPRMVPVVEAMVNLVLADHLLRSRAVK